MPSSKDKLELGLASYKSGNLVEASRHFRHPSFSTAPALAPLQLTPMLPLMYPDLTPATRSSIGLPSTLADYFFFFHHHQAAKSCQCQIGNPKLVCTCADFLAACNNGTLGDLLRQPCTCPRRASKRCTHEPHCVALAHLAIICVKTDGMNGCKSSLVYAENLVRIAPRDPRGYLRLGQALRRLKKQDTALAVYRQGIALVARANPQHQGLAWLQEQEKILSKQLIQLDPLQEFPPELLVNILSSLDTRTHCRLIRVSKSWKAFMESSAARALWTEQRFQHTGPLRIVPKGITQRYLITYPGGQLRSLDIQNCAMFPVVSKKLPVVLKGCLQLRHLSLDGPVLLDSPVLLQRGEYLPPKYVGPQLRTLHLGAGSKTDIKLLEYLVSNNRETLEQLTLLHLPMPGTFPRAFGGPLPRLRTLRLSGGEQQPEPVWGSVQSIPRVICPLEISRMAPNVQAVYLDEVTLMTGPSDAANADQWHQWTALRTLSIGKDVTITPQAEYAPIIPSLTEDHEELELLNRTAHRLVFDWRTHGNDLEWGSNIAQLPHLKKPYLPRLKRLVIADVHLYNYQGTNFDELALKWKSLIGPSVHNDTLRHLEIHPFPWFLMRDSRTIDETKKWLQPAEGATGITALGISGLAGAVGLHVSDTDDALRGLAQLFPNLRDLDIGGEPVSPATLGRIMKSGVERIYHSQGNALLSLRDWAREEGRDVIHGELRSVGPRP